MAASYLRRGMDGEATFSLFVRQLPPTRGFLVAAGLEPCLDFLEGFGLSEEELDYLGRELGFEDPVLDALGALRFDGDVWAVPEGRVVLRERAAARDHRADRGRAARRAVPAQPASRSRPRSPPRPPDACIAAAGRDVVDFALRRTQGLDAALAVARCSAIVGFVGDEQRGGRTPVRPASRRHDGALVHRVVREREGGVPHLRARLPGPHDVPGRHVRHAERRPDRDRGDPRSSACRTTSGSAWTAATSTSCRAAARALLDDAGLQRVRIFASGGLDEFELDRLVRGGAPIDAFGVGTRMGVSADAPSLDSAYKLVEYDGRPMLKLSEARRPSPDASRSSAAPTATSSVCATSPCPTATSRCSSR